MISPSACAPLFLTAFLAFGPFSGCGADHNGNRASTGGGGGPSSPNNPGSDGGGDSGATGNPGGGGGGGIATPTNAPVVGGEGPAGGTPEPATILLVTGAAAGYGALRMRRRKALAAKQEA